MIVDLAVRFVLDLLLCVGIVTGRSQAGWHDAISAIHNSVSFEVARERDTKPCGLIIFVCVRMCCSFHEKGM